MVVMGSFSSLDNSYLSYLLKRPLVRKNQCHPLSASKQAINSLIEVFAASLIEVFAAVETQGYRDLSKTPTQRISGTSFLLCIPHAQQATPPKTNLG